MLISQYTPEGYLSIRLSDHLYWDQQLYHDIIPKEITCEYEKNRTENTINSNIQVFTMVSGVCFFMRNFIFPHRWEINAGLL